jgi:hypothetical protein
VREREKQTMTQHELFFFLLNSFSSIVFDRTQAGGAWIIGIILTLYNIIILIVNTLSRGMLRKRQQRINLDLKCHSFSNFCTKLLSSFSCAYVLVFSHTLSLTKEISRNPIFIFSLLPFEQNLFNSFPFSSFKYANITRQTVSIVRSE